MRNDTLIHPHPELHIGHTQTVRQATLMMTRRLMKFTPSSLRTMWRMMTLGTVSSGKTKYLQNISVSWNRLAKSSPKVLICPKGIIFQAVMILQSPGADQSKSKISFAKDSMFRFDYSIYFLRWALKPPEYLRRSTLLMLNQCWLMQPPNSYRVLAEAVILCDSVLFFGPLTSNLCRAVTHFKLEQAHLPPKAPVSVRRTRSFSTSTWVIADRGESSTRGLQWIRAVHLGYIYIYVYM